MLEPMSSLPPKTRLERFRERLVAWKVSEYWESWYPTGCGGLTFIVVLLYPISAVSYKAFIKDVVPTAVSVAAILAGFQGTIHTILLSIRKSRAVRELQQSGHFTKLVSFVGSGVLSLLIFVAVAMGVLAFRAATLDTGVGGSKLGQDVIPSIWSATRLFSAMLTALFVHAIASSIRIIRLVVLLLKVSES
jgi:hypothetical protein